MKRLEYLIPEMDVVEFEVEDVVTSSPPSGGGLNYGGVLDSEDNTIDSDKLFPL